MDHTNRIRTRSFRRPRSGADNFPDTARTTRNHAGEGLENERNLPGMILFVLGIVGLALTLTAAGYGFAGWSIVAAIVTILLIVAGTALLLREHMRMKAREGLRLRDQRGH
ncbi:hypothetical protein [Nocardia vaccinii]|uniref:hypothetical protein n=1 Tax=Nocardia vaccinii TaxID=1822 RepID=UPI000AE75DFC|nr:hypothetical protein [Nocardia vaccinii]